MNKKILDKRANSSGVPRDVYSGLSQALLWIGRALLILSAISLITMPLTQRLWTWDRFLHGGQDFELGALMVLILLSLVLVISKDCKRCLDSLFAEWRFLRSNLANWKLVGIPQRAGRSAYQIEPGPCPALRSGSFPIRI
jgi:hypothetical protein